MTDAPPNSTMIFGEVAVTGAASGSAFVCVCAAPVRVPRRTIGEDEVPGEMERFDAAVSRAAQHLLDLQRGGERHVGNHAAGIFAAHSLILRDVTLRNEIGTICLTEKVNVEVATEKIIDKWTAKFDRMEDPHFRARAADFRDIGNRLLDILAGGRGGTVPALPEGSIIVTDEILPSLITQLERNVIRGLILERGGQTAHAMILARSLGIPALIQVPDCTTRIQTGDRLIVDGVAGRVFVNPSPTIVREYDKLREGLKAHQHALQGIIKLPTVTLDGVEIKLRVNAGKVADAPAVAALNADGIGLYRTEFMFMAQDHFPSEEEQYQMYRAAADRVKPHKMVIRILDLGSDKRLPYFPRPHEDNPSLGRRGIRLLLGHPDILRTQLRAILRVSAAHPVAVLFPMIGDVEELLAAKTALEDAKVELAGEGQPFNHHIVVGAMIETPSAVILVRHLAQHVDFLSVGTNDLVQYLLTTDRTSSEMASYYEPLHPAVLQALSSLATTARECGKGISICGEMAGNAAYTALLLGLGFRSLSVSSGEFLEVKNVIRSTRMDRAESLATKVLASCTVGEIKACLHDARSS
ncbi:MAG: phosphoenolpyruvate--protein phosphotransferase [Tepidisphaeraceae bacterium]|jgi:phosphotransferase system enzyme I (PtsI)